MRTGGRAISARAKSAVAAHRSLWAGSKGNVATRINTSYPRRLIMVKEVSFATTYDPVIMNGWA